MLNQVFEIFESVLSQRLDCNKAVLGLPQGWVQIQQGENVEQEIICTLAGGTRRAQLHFAQRNSVWYVGRRLRFGYPLPYEGDGESEISWFIPDDELRNIARLEEFAFGKMSFDSFHRLVNHTARMEMAKPLARFPRSCLMMQYGAPLPLRKGIPQPPERYFVLWTQLGTEIDLHELPRTQNPFEAAEHSRELGFSPTIYRCTSGHMVPFKPTDGWPFIQGAG